MNADKEALVNLGEWLDAGLLPEVTPTRQARSLRSTYAMLEAGRYLLEEKSLEDLSVEAIGQLAGTTVGAFYGRFENKDAFFVTMQKVQAMRIEKCVIQFRDRHSAISSTVEDVIADMVALLISIFRENVGVIRAALQHTKEGMWQVFRDSGAAHRRVFAETLASRLGSAHSYLRAEFAYQVVVGVLVHTTLIGPGPLYLESEELQPELARITMRYLV